MSLQPDFCVVTIGLRCESIFAGIVGLRVSLLHQQTGAEKGLHAGTLVGRACVVAGR